MILYNLRIALRSLKRNPWLSAVIMAAIALGIGVSTLFTTMRHALARDPIPQKSDRLYYVRVDAWDPQRDFPSDIPGTPPDQVTYRDAVALVKSDVPTHAVIEFKAFLVVFPPGDANRAKKMPVRMTTGDFFPMFDVPFLYGSGWDRKVDESADQVAVLTRETNDQLFGGGNSVGKTLRIESREFRVVGVMDTWRPAVKFYDTTNNPLGEPEGVFLPFGLIRPMQLKSAGNNNGWGPSAPPGFEAALMSENEFIQMWAELPTRDHVDRYKAFLDAYAMEQKKVGRFQRPLNNRLTPLMAYLTERKVVPAEVNAMAIVSLLFLAVCALNLTGLLLGKFLARAPEIGVRRALGARRTDIFMQHIVECELVALLGGALGVALSLGGLSVINAWAKTFANRSDLFSLDLPMTAAAAGLSLAAGLIAGVYPAWRVCRIAPAIHLKVQ
jgi:putative ABC transport system permease protein